MMFDYNEMSKKVLDRLSKLQTLPSNGFLAGGAVANTILSIIDGKDYPINDIDVFVIDNTLENTPSNTPIRTDDNIVFEDRYENIMVNPDVANSYSIKKTSLEGLINYVFVSFRSNSPNLISYERILKSFDINCCKAGIDLENGNLIIDDHFMEFINGRQLECNTPVTPAHSAIRLLKKRDDLNAFLDKESSFKFLSQFYHFNENVLHCKLNISLFFGQKYKELYLKYESELSEYFKLSSYAQVFKEYHNNNVKKLITNHKWWDIISSVDPEAMHFWHERKTFTLLPIKYTSLDDGIKEYLLPNYMNNPYNLNTIWNLLYNQSKKQKEKALKFLNNKILYSFIISNKKFHLCDFNDKNIDHFVRFISNNPKVESLILVSKLNFQDAEKLIYNIKKFFPREVDIFVDIITKEIINNNLDPKQLTDKNYVIEKYNDVKKVLSVPLTEASDLSDFEFVSNVKELNSEFDLTWGGRYMHNCLGNNNFGGRIKENKLKVFIISDKDNRTAIQLNNNSGLYSVSQIFGIGNTPPNDKHKLIAQYLMEFLNYKHYLLESEKKISKFESLRRDMITNINSKSSKDRSEENINFTNEPIRLNFI